MECLHVWVAVASAFQSLLAELVVMGWSVVHEHVLAAHVAKGSEHRPVRVVADEAPRAKRGVLWVTMSGLLSVSLTLAEDDTPVPLAPLALAYIRARHSAVFTKDVGLLLEARQAHGRDWHSGLSWSERAFLTYLSACTGAGSPQPSIRLPPWADRSTGAKRVVWPPEGVLAPHDDVIVLSSARCASVMDSAFRIGRLWTLQWMDPVGYEGFVPLRQQLQCL